MTDERCDWCGEPATYIRKAKRDETLCEVCAHVQHGEWLGERYAAAEMFMGAAQAAERSGLTGAELHALVAEALEQQRPAGGVDVPALSSDRRRSEWDRGLSRLEQSERVA